MDTKATINVGPFSRGGTSRTQEAVAAADHDMMIKEKLVPGGILEVKSGASFLFFTGGCKTSDFMVDGLELWWSENSERLDHIRRLVINLDNGPECSGSRSQFLKRMVAFSDKVRLEIRLVYYPPYHSKYNAIERYWAVLERSWNGYLLDCIDSILKRAAHFTWKSIHPFVAFIDAVYQKGITVVGDEKRDIEKRIIRSEILPKWDITILPNTVY